MTETIKLAGIVYYIIKRSNEEMQGHIGLADFNRQEISINTTHTHETQKIAILHEIIHIASDVYGLGLSEEQVKIGTHALLAFLRDNPDFKIDDT